MALTASGSFRWFESIDDDDDIDDRDKGADARASNWDHVVTLSLSLSLLSFPRGVEGVLLMLHLSCQLYSTLCEENVRSKVAPACRLLAVTAEHTGRQSRPTASQAHAQWLMCTVGLK